MNKKENLMDFFVNESMSMLQSQPNNQNRRNNMLYNSIDGGIAADPSKSLKLDKIAVMRDK